MTQDRYVLVAFDKQTGEASFVPEMLERAYTKVEAEAFLETFSKTLTDIRTFMVVPYIQAIQILEAERDDIVKGKSKRTLH